MLATPRLAALKIVVEPMRAWSAAAAEPKVQPKVRTTANTGRTTTDTASSERTAGPAARRKLVNGRSGRTRSGHVP
jgi:hypothetical protein